MPNYRRDSPCPVESQFVNSCQAFNGTAAGPFARGGRSMVLASALLVLGCRPLTGAPIADWTTSWRLGVLPDVVANVLSAAWGYCLGVGCTFVNENVNTPNGPLQGLGNLGTAVRPSPALLLVFLMSTYPRALRCSQLPRPRIWCLPANSTSVAHLPGGRRH